ncbi:hypothetical protein VHEMI08897 [[Torrubiella] hemipterigena]|uniref:BTB domain-containing protein n=1 Tax=[Torrubiella] hemipterigena TaxID=1531966 RepID=A0A0A1TPC9_9HYPO|nr:hypothetical protein VHEMI08897 [[Torrubiella] hemipterigena]
MEPNRAPQHKANFEIIIHSMPIKRKYSSDSGGEETESEMSQTGNVDDVDANETEVVDTNETEVDDTSEHPIIDSVPLDDTLPHLNAASSQVEAVALALIATHDPIKRESSMEEIGLTGFVPEPVLVPVPAPPRRGRPRRQAPAPHHMAAPVAPTAAVAPALAPPHWSQGMQNAQGPGYAAGMSNTQFYAQGSGYAASNSNTQFSGHAVSMSDAQFFGHATGISTAQATGYGAAMTNAQFSSYAMAMANTQSSIHLVEVVVGTQHRPIYVARHLLCNSSRRLAADLENPRTTRLLRYQDSPRDFDLYVHWLKHRTVNVSNLSSAQTHWMLWARLSVLGRRLEDDLFQTAIIDSIIYKYRGGLPPGDYPGHEVMTYLWTEGRTAKGLTQLYMDIWAHWCSRRFTVTLDELKRLPAEFLAALYLTMSRELVKRGIELSVGFHLGVNREAYMPGWPANQPHYNEDA